MIGILTDGFGFLFLKSGENKKIILILYVYIINNRVTHNNTGMYTKENSQQTFQILKLTIEHNIEWAGSFQCARTITKQQATNQTISVTIWL